MENGTGFSRCSPLLEESPLRTALYPYRGKFEKELDDYEKILVEKVVMNGEKPVGTIFRLPLVYGPGDRQHRLFPYLKRIKDKRPAILVEETRSKWKAARGYVENVAHAISLAATNDAATGKIYNVAEPIAFSEKDWISKIAITCTWQGKIISVPKEKFPPTMQEDLDFNHHLVVDTSKIRSGLGFKEQVPLDKALIRTIHWELDNPPAKIDPKEFDYKSEDVLLSTLKKT